MSKCPAHIRIGTRASALAVAQANEVKNRLLGAYPDELTQNQIEIIKITTTGDKIQNRSLAEIGGKGLFTKELEEALFANQIDMAVHSMKDMPDYLPENLIIECILEREDPRDALISNIAENIDSLPQGAIVGTSSLRRQAQILIKRPDLKVVPFRGNVNTRIRKLEEKQVDATVLAVGGLKRVDMENHITEKISLDVMLPAVAQGSICVECVESNEHILRVLKKINHSVSYAEVKAERSFLKALGGSCVTPAAGYAVLDENGYISFKGAIFHPEGEEKYQVERKGLAQDAREFCYDAGEEIIKNAGHLLRF